MASIGAVEAFSSSVIQETEVDIDAGTEEELKQFLREMLQTNGVGEETLELIITAFVAGRAYQTQYEVQHEEDPLVQVPMRASKAAALLGDLLEGR